MKSGTVARWAVAAAALGVAGAEVIATGSAACVPAALAAVVLAWGRKGLRPWALMAVAAVSLMATADPAAATSNRAAAWWIAETAVLIALVASGSRRAATGFEAAALIAAIVAIGLSPLRVGLRMDPPAAPEELALLVVLWTAAAAAAASFGRLLRRQRAERDRAVGEARRSQRLSLARDLHDYVAHDVTGMVVQAQAAQMVGAREPAHALAALARIETAGLQALSSLDRTVLLLREHDDLLRDPGDGFTDIAVLARRFEETGGARTAFVIDRGLTGLTVPEPVRALAHRVAAEALTNVRRHAPDAAEVRISLSRLPDALAVEIANDLPTVVNGQTSRIAGGSGLRQLERSVADLGGSFAAGPVDDATWRVSAVLPL
ncbi:histidine kinase [Glycomyces sp. NPDC046736]|uniref:sensor histidine kinase n=1 Tax=Glycomyces sp. NPDC046736 TaxID=3155615 RepID=UPI0033E60A40